jgi:Ca2+-binding RTX toxin-like protein
MATAAVMGRKQAADDMRRRFIIKSVHPMSCFLAYLAHAVNSSSCGTKLMTFTRSSTPVVALVLMSVLLLLLLVPVLAAFAANITGTNGNDNLRGTRNSDTIRARGGDDLVYGRGSSDNLYGGRGNDKVFGANGNDNIYGWYGTNLLDGGPGRDTIYATGIRECFPANDPCNTWNNVIYGRDGSDRVIVSYTDATIRGGRGNDRINVNGDSEDNSVRVHGQQGNDFIRSIGPIYGDSGNDVIHVSNDGNTQAFGGPGHDRIFDHSPPEGGRLEGGPGNDYIELVGHAEGMMTGGPGADTFVCPSEQQITFNEYRSSRVVDYNPDEGDTIPVGQCGATINDDDCDDDETKRMLTEAKEKVVEKFMPLGGEPSSPYGPYGVNRVGVDDLHCEIIVTVNTEQDRINFPISSMDGFPIRVQVGSISLLEDPKATVPEEENATAPPPPTTTPQPQPEPEPQPEPPSTDDGDDNGGGNSTG